MKNLEQILITLALLLVCSFANAENISVIVGSKAKKTTNLKTGYFLLQNPTTGNFYYWDKNSHRGEQSLDVSINGKNHIDSKFIFYLKLSSNTSYEGAYYNLYQMTTFDGTTIYFAINSTEPAYIPYSGNSGSLSYPNDSKGEFTLTNPVSDGWNNYVRVNVYGIELIANFCIINASSSDITKGSVSGSGEYDANTNVTLTATPNEGYEFVRWSNGVTDNPYTFTALRDSILIATFQTKKSCTNITDGNSYTNNGDYACDEITYTRTFSSTNWQALYVPFSMKYDDWKDKLDVYDIYNVLAYDEDNNGEIERTTVNMIRLKEGAVTEPNYPYVVRAKNAGDVEITLTDGTLYAAEENSIDCTSTKQKFTFTGTYEPMTGLYTKGCYALDGGVLKTAIDDAVTLKPQRWYMEVTNRNGSPAAATRVYLNPFGEENEVEGVKGVAVNVIGEETTYDLNGRAVNAAQLPKGLYVRGGKKIIVK